MTMETECIRGGAWGVEGIFARGTSMTNILCEGCTEEGKISEW